MTTDASPSEVILNPLLLQPATVYGELDGSGVITALRVVNHVNRTVYIGFYDGKDGRFVNKSVSASYSGPLTESFLPIPHNELTAFAF